MFNLFKEFKEAWRDVKTEELDLDEPIKRLDEIYIESLKREIKELEIMKKEEEKKREAEEEKENLIFDNEEEFLNYREDKLYKLGCEELKLKMELNKIEIEKKKWNDVNFEECHKRYEEKSYQRYLSSFQD